MIFETKCSRKYIGMDNKIINLENGFNYIMNFFKENDAVVKLVNRVNDIADNKCTYEIHKRDFFNAIISFKDMINKFDYTDIDKFIKTNSIKLAQMSHNGNLCIDIAKCNNRTLTLVIFGDNPVVLFEEKEFIQTNLYMKSGITIQEQIQSKEYSIVQPTTKNAFYSSFIKSFEPLLKKKENEQEKLDEQKQKLQTEIEKEQKDLDKLKTEASNAIEVINSKSGSLQYINTELIENYNNTKRTNINYNKDRQIDQVNGGSKKRHTSKFSKIKKSKFLSKRKSFKKKT